LALAHIRRRLKPLADAFTKLIKMLAPIIFCTVVIGIAHVGDLKSVGRIGVKGLIYFEVVTTFALLFGLVIGNVVKPGTCFNIDPHTLATGAEAVAKKTGDAELPHTVRGRPHHGLDAGLGEPAGQLCGDTGGGAMGRPARHGPNAEGVARPDG
jgi:Na+/H+-dicarboxylate symporter